MITNITPDDLKNFELDIANEFNQGHIKAPIHLQSNCFEQLIEIFRDIKEDDWILGTWRFHAETLLKGVPKEKVKQAILDGKSISLCFPEYRTFASAIVTGNLPIAVGLALDIKRSGGKNKVWVFCGEMTATTGAFYESVSYSMLHELPIAFIVSDNGKSVCTDTRKVWNIDRLSYEPWGLEEGKVNKTNYVWYYKYQLDWPHSGSGRRIEF